MKKTFSVLGICVLLLSLLAPCACASEVSSAFTQIVTRDNIGGTLLLAEYPADEYYQSFEGEAYDWYKEVYSYEDVGVVVTNERKSRFDGTFDEVLAVTQSYGQIRSAEWIDIESFEDAELTSHIRFKCKVLQDTEGPTEWVVDVVKVYQTDYCFMFTVARDADGKNYARKVDTLIDSLKLGVAAEAVDTDENNFFSSPD